MITFYNLQEYRPQKTAAVDLLINEFQSINFLPGRNFGLEITGEDPVSTHRPENLFFATSLPWPGCHPENYWMSNFSKFTFITMYKKRLR